VRSQASSVVVPTGITAMRRMRSGWIPKQPSAWSAPIAGQPMAPSMPSLASVVTDISVAGCPPTLVLATWESSTPYLVSPRRYAR
jgi:hypothetical protein